MIWTFIYILLESIMKHLYLCLLNFFILAYSFDFRQVQSISQTSRVINTYTNNTFLLDRTTDNSYSQTDYRTTYVSPNATVVIIFPTVFTLDSNVTCLSITVDSVAINTFNCSVSGSSVTFYNVFATISNLNVSNVVVTIGNIKNPSPAITIANFSGYIGTDYAVPLGASIIQLLPGAFQNCSVTFSPGYVNLASSVLIASMAPSDPHLTGSSIVIQFPKSTWTNDISAQALPITSTMTCSSYTANINSGIQCVGTSSSSLITVTNLFSTSVSSTFSFGIQNFLSPPSNQPSDAITITSYYSGSKLDTCNVYPSGLSPISFSNFSVVALSTMRINTLVSLRFIMYPSMTINGSDYFSITFPTGTTYTYNQIFGTGYYTTPTFTGQTVLIYHNTSTSSSTYAQNALYSLTFASFMAPPSTIPTSALTMQILRNGYPIMTGSTTLTAVSSTLTASVTVASSIVWANTTYTFTINTSNPLTAQGMIKIVFPSTVTPPRTSVCASLLGINMNSLPTCTYDSGSNSITISNINASSTVTTISAQNNITLAIIGVVNPADTTTTGTFSITTYYTGNTQGVVDVGSVAGITSTPGTISINTVSVVPSSYVVMQSGVTYNFNFNNTYLIPINGYIVLFIPTDITIVTALLPSYCKLSIGGATYSSTTCSVVTNSSFYQVSFTSPAQTSSIPAGSAISLQILSLCTNPTNTRIITPFQLFTYSSTAAIQSRTTGITVQMVTPASFTIVQVTRSSQQNSALNPYTITLKQQAALPAGSFLIVNLPNELVFTANSSCTDLAGSVLNCTEGSYRSMQVTLGAVAANTLFGVIISNVRNPPSYKPTATNFTFQTKTSDLVNSYATGVYSTPFSNSVPSTFQLISYSFSPAQYSSSETLTIVLTPSAFIAPTTLIVEVAQSFTVQNLSCSSQTGFSAPCVQLPPDSMNISGTLGSSQLQFSISGFTSPTYAPSDYTFVSSYDSSGYLVDQSTNNILYSVRCQVPCQSCTSNVTACTSCYKNANITSNNYLLLLNNSCLTTCPTGYYADTLLVCTSCSSTCLTCNTVSSNCTSCNTSSTYPALNLTGSSGVCLSSCPIYYYLSLSLSPRQCTPCVTPCLTCTALNSCLSCLAGYYYYNLSCLTTCPYNTTIPNNGTWNCDLCSEECATCLGTVSTCTTCSSKAAKYEGTCVTECPSPYVISSGICANCSSSCLTCSLVSYNCTSCYPSTSTSLLFTSNASLGTCLATCPFKYYSDSAQGLCLSCSLLNINCTNCSSTITCYNCDYGSGMVFYNSQCLSTTPTGYYNSSGIAVACNSSCSSCLNATHCTACVSLSLSNYQCVSSCPSNQVSVSRVCVACTYPCLTCSNTQTNCTSCNSTIANPYFLLIGSCLQSCPNYTFANSNGWLCSSCISPCEMCSTNASCLSCANGYNLYNQTCSVSCPLGYVGINKICTACTSNCSTCSGSSSYCLSCVLGTYLYNTSSPTCSSSCPFGLYPNNSTQSCTGCVSPCSTCYGMANNCTSCTSGLLQINQCVSNCSLGYYPLGTSCIACNSNCTTCTSATICTACLTPLVLLGTSCVTSCPSTSPVVNSANQCSSCTDTYCLNCSSLNYCYQCFYPKLYFQGACLSSCPSGYSANVNYTCVYSPSNSSAETLASSLSTSSIFPVPFTIGAAFLIVACLMSKFQHSRTDIIGSLYALWGLLEWGAIVFLLLYYLQMMGTQSINRLSFFLVAGGLAWIYLLNIIFLFIQVFSLKKNRRFVMWLGGSINTCWYHAINCLCLLTIGKFKFILFCKLFNFRSLSAKLDDVGALRSLHAYAFSSIISSVATLSGAIFFLVDYGFTVNQLLMAYIDVIVLSLLQLVLGICNTKKQEDFFQDIDEDGLMINKRIEIREQEHPSGVMPDFNESDRHDYGYKALQSAKKLDASYLSDMSNRKSLRDISIQAESILGERSLISRLGTETISDLSFFDKQDVSIQMDPIRNVQDVSIAASDRAGKKHDVSIGQSVIFMDASVLANRVSQRDVSIDQTRRFQEEMSVQMEPNHCEISIQMDDPEQHQISVQYVPIYTDQTVHMTREEEDLGIQCNAEQQNISIQYSAKPLIQHVDQALPSQNSFSMEEPSDLDLQRKLVLHPPAPQETGMRVELQLDIQEKLERKKRELEKLQEERKERERQEAIRAFQSHGSKQEVSVGKGAVQDNSENPANERRNADNIFNEYSDSSNNLVHSSQELTLDLQEQIDRKQKVLDVDSQQKQLSDLNGFRKKEVVYQQSSQITERQFNQERPQHINQPSETPTSMNQQVSVQQNKGKKERDDKSINNFFNNDHSNPSSLIQTIDRPLNEASRVNTEQEFIQMLSGNHPEPLSEHPSLEQQQQQQKVKVKFQMANKVIENDEQFLEEYDATEHFEPLQQNSIENPARSIEKSRSTAVLTGRPPMARREQQSNMLESSQNSIDGGFDDDDAIVSRPMHPRREFQVQVRTFKKEELEKASKTSLTQFLEKRSMEGRRNNMMEEDDALTREIQNEYRQRPLPAPRAEAFGSEQSFASHALSSRPPLRNTLRKESFEEPDQLALQAQKSLNRGPQQLGRSGSKKQLEREVRVERARDRGYLRETYSSEEKKKSLQKIYLNKVVKK